MKKALFFLLVPILLFSSVACYAQFPYNLTVSKQPYLPLKDGINMVSEVWFNSDYIPFDIPFDMLLDTLHCTSPYIAGGCTLVTDTNSLNRISAFFLTDANLIDKGFLGSDLIFMSPIRYEVTGSLGSRIFKIEVANAAFFNEIIYGTQLDSLYMQLWLYEKSNIVELRYGPSNISHGYNYFPNKGFPCVGYIQNVDSGLSGTYHILAGNPDSPFVESIVSVSGKLASKPTGLNSFPGNGTVYRFTPVGLAVKNSPNANNAGVKLYPTICSNELMIDNYPANSENTTYSIYAPNGALQLSGALRPNATTHVDVSTLQAGVYLVQIKEGKKIEMTKIIKL